MENICGGIGVQKDGKSTKTQLQQTYMGNSSAPRKLDLEVVDKEVIEGNKGA